MSSEKYIYLRRVKERTNICNSTDRSPVTLNIIFVTLSFLIIVALLNYSLVFILFVQSTVLDSICLNK